MTNSDKTIGIEIIAVCFIMPGAALLMTLGGLAILVVFTWNPPSWGNFLYALFITSLGIPFFRLGYRLRRKSYPSWISSIIGVILLGLLLSVMLYYSPYGFLGIFRSLMILLVTLISLLYLIKAKDEFTRE